MSWLVLASLTLHAAFLGWQTSRELAVPELASRSGNLTVQLTELQAPAPARPEATAPAPTPKPQEKRPEPVDQQAPEATHVAPAARGERSAETSRASETSPDSVRQSTQAPRPAETPTENLASFEPEPAHSTADNNEPEAVDQTSAPNSTAVLEDIRDALHEHFFYPRLARLRNWEGDVLLGFQVRPDGVIDDVHILESSGRSILDQAAMRALRSVQQIAYTQPRSLALELPVTYRLH